MEQSAKYIYQVYLSKSFSRASRALYISQPSLSATVAAKEKELGFRVFDRATKPISLTPEGEIYIETLEEILRTENEMHHRLRQLQKKPQEAVRVGSGCYTSYYLLPTVCGVFARQHPDIALRFDLGNAKSSASLLEKLDEGDLDLLFSYDYDPKKHKAYPIFTEQMTVGMHKSLMTPALAPYALTKEELLSESYPAEKLLPSSLLFHDVPFLPFEKNSNTERYMSDILGIYTVSPHKIIDARHSGVHFNMMQAGLGAVLTSTSAVRTSGAQGKSTVYFALPKEQTLRTLYAVARKHDRTEERVRLFLETAMEVCRDKRCLSLDMT